MVKFDVKLYQGVLFLLLACGAGVTGAAADGERLEQQRSMFMDARKALQAGRTEEFTRLARELKDYALYPYLEYADLSRRLWRADDGEISGFLDRYRDLPVARDLRRSWLGILARRKRWQVFVDHYTPQSDEILRCYYLHGRMMLGRDAYLLEDIRSMWLAGESRPDQCDPVFARLYQSSLMTPELLWQRIRLAMANGKTSLASYLSRRLPEPDQQWVAHWLAVYHNPARATLHPGYPDEPRAREILVYGIKRLARRNIDLALKHWDGLRAGYQFSPEQVTAVERDLAIRAARGRHPRAPELLDAVAAPPGDEDIFNWRLVTALDRLDWQRLRSWTEGEPPAPDSANRWRYWHARALEQTGAADAAREEYRKVARERDYYGFRAADHLGQAYHFDHRPTAVDDAGRAAVAELPGLIRARELYHVDLHYSARREWYDLINGLDREQLQIAAALAAQWQWHDRTILTLGKAQAYDDLVLRFPLVYEPLLRKYAGKRKLDISWMYALTRAESAFMEDARSGAGALGLMQVMPDTGRQTAKSIGFRSYHNSYLLEADKNVTIGSAYLQQLLKRFNGNMVLATAAYNAGPNAVSTWLPPQGCLEPDIWIELIPYVATRKYVSRILYYASIYDWRLQQDVLPVKQRMAQVPARNQLRAGGLSCHSQVASAP